MEEHRGVKASDFDPTTRENVASTALGTGDGEAVLDPTGQK